MIQSHKFHTITSSKTNPLKSSHTFSSRLMNKLVVVGLLAGLLGACAEVSALAPTVTSNTETGPDGKPADTEKAFNRFPDIPVPTQSQMDVRQSLVFGSDEDWYGQLVLTTKHDGDSMFDFYKQELPGFDWEEITSVRGPTSVLTYMRAERVLSIQVVKGNITGATITLTVSPRGGTKPQ